MVLHEVVVGGTYENAHGFCYKVERVEKGGSEAPPSATAWGS